MNEFIDLYFNLVYAQNYSPSDLVTLLVKYDTLTDFEQYEVIKGLKNLAEQEIQQKEFSCNQMRQSDFITEALRDYVK